MCVHFLCLHCGPELRQIHVNVTLSYGAVTQVCAQTESAVKVMIICITVSVDADFTEYEEKMNGRFNMVIVQHFCFCSSSCAEEADEDLNDTTVRAGHKPIRLPSASFGCVSRSRWPSASCMTEIFLTLHFYQTRARAQQSWWLSSE